MAGQYGGGGLRGLGREMVRRTTQPWRSSTFFLGFVLNAVFGGWAIWFEMGLTLAGQPKHDLESIQLALVTFFPAVTGVTFIQVMLEQHDDTRLTLSSLLFFFAIFASSTYLIFHTDHFGFTRFSVLLLLFIMTLWFWVIANCDSKMFTEKVDNATGGNPEAPLSGDPGVGVQ